MFVVGKQPALVAFGLQLVFGTEAVGTGEFAAEPAVVRTVSNYLHSSKLWEQYFPKLQLLIAVAAFVIVVIGL